MYTPSAFEVNDPAELAAFMRRHSFATLVTHDGAGAHATHVPVVLENDGAHGTLVTHLARGNPQWRHAADGQEVLVIFTGPHAYVSPRWFQTSPAVPTWNYTAVHAYGRARIVEDQARFAEMLGTLVEAFEAGRADRWDGELPADYRDRLMRGIVGLEITITRLEGKWKLGQNRPEDMPGVIAALAQSADQTERETAALMEQVHGALLGVGGEMLPPRTVTVCDGQRSDR